MEKVLIIESSGLTFQCDSVSPVIKESTDKTGMMILRGVPATILNKENGNGRRYTKKEMQKAIRKRVTLVCSRIVACFAPLMIIRKNRFLLLLMPLMLL